MENYYCSWQWLAEVHNSSAISAMNTFRPAEIDLFRSISLSIVSSNLFLYDIIIWSSAGQGSKVTLAKSGYFGT